MNTSKYWKEYLAYCAEMKKENEDKAIERHLNPDIENFFYNLVLDLNKQFPEGSGPLCF